MNFVDSIGYSLDVIQKNVTQLTLQAQGMPEPTEVQVITGGGSEAPEMGFTTRLSDAAVILAKQVQTVRTFITQHADALNAAAERLQGTDSTSGTSVAQATSLIEGVVASEQAPTGGGSSPAPGGTSSSSSSSGGGTSSTSGL